MKKEIKELWGKVVKFHNETPEAREERKEEEKYEEFIKKVEKRMDKSFSVNQATTREGRARVALMFENAYTQKKIVEANKILGTATIVLAIATTALVITIAYGTSGLEKTINEIIRGIFAFIVVIAIIWVIGGFALLIKLFWKIFRKK